MRSNQSRQAPEARSDEQLRASTAMSAIVQDVYGDADVLRLERSPGPRSAGGRSWCGFKRRAWTAAPGT
jgi:hypothetical protein